MKTVSATLLAACVLCLSACATPTPEPAADASVASEGAVFEDKGELLTGSRIPQKSTMHTLKRVGSAEYKKSRADNNSGTVKSGSQ